MRYADDTVLIADTREKLKLMFDRVKEKSENKGLKINARKTKSMVITEITPAPRVGLRCWDHVVEQVESFSYLGSVVTEDGM